MQRNSIRPRLVVTGDGRCVVGHAGSRLVCDLADELGLSEALSVAMAPTKRRRRGHDRGRVLVDLAVMLAGGGETISDLATLRDQPQLFGEVASLATAWRTLEAIDDTVLDRIAIPRAAARREAWAAGADPGFYVIDIDATLVTAHSEKEQAAPTYKRGFGFHPLLAFLDATGEALAAKLRPGNAGSGTATDHVEVLDAALAQLPVDPTEREVIARADSAGLSHGFVDACAARSVRFVIGHRLTAEIATVLVNVAESAWRPALSADGSDERSGGEVVEVTELVDLSAWGEDVRMIARREDPIPARNSPSPTSTGIASRSWSPTWSTPISRTSKRSTADAVVANDRSVTPKTPDWRTCHRRRSRSTPPGCNSCSSRMTSSPGRSCSVSTVNSHRGTETVALLPPPHRGNHHPRQSSPPVTHRRRLALEQRPRQRVRTRTHPRPTNLTCNHTPRAATRGSHVHAYPTPGRRTAAQLSHMRPFTAPPPRDDNHDPNLQIMQPY